MAPKGIGPQGALPGAGSARRRPVGWGGSEPLTRRAGSRKRLARGAADGRLGREATGGLGREATGGSAATRRAARPRSDGRLGRDPSGAGLLAAP
jgi:hypothetical protein